MKYVVSIFLMMCFQVMSAQESRFDMKKPSWVSMLESEDANYYETIKAFKSYWKTIPEPIEEENAKFSEADKKAQIDFLKTLTVPEHEFFNYLKYQCKRFEDWKKSKFPYVQQDGSILNQSQIQAIWDKQQLEIQQQKNK